MLYNELDQEDILSGVRLRLATIAYVDILLRSIGPVYKIRQTPAYNCCQYPYSTIEGRLDSLSLSNTSLDCLIRHRAAFGALGACYAVPCCLTRLRPGKDGSSPYSTPSGHFLRLPAAERWR